MYAKLIFLCLSLCIILFGFFIVYKVEKDKYFKPEDERTELLHREQIMSVGGGLKLTIQEKAVNAYLMNFKHEELDYEITDKGYINWCQHYFTYRKKIRNSSVYNIIKDMPKGAVLHIHDMGILNADYLLKLTYTDNLYVHFGEKDKIIFKFAKDTPTSDGHEWRLLSEMRKNCSDPKKFDLNLKKYFTLNIKNPELNYPTTGLAWDALMDYFFHIEPLLTYRPVWERYLYDALKMLRKEKIIYVEVRTVLPQLYELDESVLHPIFTAKIYAKIISQFVKEYPDFLGAKLIYSPIKHINLNELKNELALATQIKKEIPEYFAGFDPVGQENIGLPLKEFFPVLSNITNMNLFLHAGETNKYGSMADENLLDAILLKSKRICHGYSLAKHPLLIQEVIKRDIAVEVNVISNNVLGLVKDARNHPLSILLAHGVPVVLSSDNPGVWGADPISHDFYVAFSAVAHQQADLRLLKILALNSIQYSTLNDREKLKGFTIFNKQWDLFVHRFNNSKYDMSNNII